MPNKVYIKVTEEMTGDYNVIKALEREGALDARELDVSGNRIYLIDDSGYVSCVSLDRERHLRERGYREIKPEANIYTLPLRRGATSAIITFDTPKGFVASIDGSPVSEIKVELQRKMWTPEKDKIYYHVEMSKNAMYVSSSVWTDSIADRQALYLENVFKTKEEASQFLEILKSHYWKAAQEYEANIPGTL